MAESPEIETIQASNQVSVIRPLIFLLLLAAIILTVRLFHLQDYFEEQRLRQLIASFGIWGPIVYLAVWSLAPALFLPGLPITLAGGVLFGAFWGVVYTGIGSTVGASLAFLTARYLAREWVAAQLLRGTKLATLDDKVARHGWKIVAFTRLIPVFPYFLLNYAFGLTRISLAAYAVATFFAMLPWTIAFVYFSSHILDLLKGNLSPGLVIGVILVVLVSIIPLIYKKMKRKEGGPLEF
jgi:uncharacterized membrane protein YdjX (TVP38/TMEM64 family)